MDIKNPLTDDVGIELRDTPPNFWYKVKAHNANNPIRDFPITNEDYNQTVYRAKLRVLEDSTRRYYQELQSNKKYEDLLGNEDQVQSYAAMMSHLDSMIGRGTPYGYFITISPEHDSPEKLDDLMAKITTKIWMVDYIWCIEKASKYHAHIYVRAHRKPPSEASKEIRNTCKIFGTHNIKIDRIKQADEVKVVRYIKKDGEFYTAGHFRPETTDSMTGTLTPQLVFL